MSDQNMIIVMGATAVVTILTTAAPFLIFDHLRIKRQSREANRHVAGAAWYSLEAGLPRKADTDA